MLRQAHSSYNERLFGGGLRRYLHLSRFRWMSWAVRRYWARPHSVLELGCYDARSLDYLPARPLYYTGLDANWENGLDLATERWGHQHTYRFHECHTHWDMRSILGPARFDINLCMETFEHIPPEEVTPYLRTIRDVTTRLLFITVPNEKGPVFLLKHLVKGVCGNQQGYKAQEVVAASLGLMHWVERHEHKGFDYTAFVREVARTWEIRHVSAYPLRLAPKVMSFGIGIVASP